MKKTFPEEQTCPRCKGTFSEAELKEEYHPVVVIICPICSGLIWRPGLDEISKLFPFDPDADAGGI